MSFLQGTATLPSHVIQQASKGQTFSNAADTAMHDAYETITPAPSSAKRAAISKVVHLRLTTSSLGARFKLNPSMMAQVLAYGQTGSGKTYSMGSAADPSQLNGRSKPYGVIPRALVNLFEGLQQLQPDYEVASKVLHQLTSL